MTNETSKDQDLVWKGAGVHTLIANVYAKGPESKKSPYFMQVSKFKRIAGAFEIVERGVDVGYGWKELQVWCDALRAFCCSIVSLRRSPVCWQNCHALPIESAVGAALGNLEDTRGLACAPVKESASMVYFLVRYFLHSPLGKGLAGFCLGSEQQLEEGRPMGGGDVAGDSGVYMARPRYLIWNRIICRRKGFWFFSKSYQLVSRRLCDILKFLTWEKSIGKRTFGVSGTISC